MPHIIVPEIQEAIKNSKAKTMYICNMLTQPGETDGFNVSNHIKVLEKHLGKGSVDVVIANNSSIPKNMSLLAKSEGKDVSAMEKSLGNRIKGVRILASLATFTLIYRYITPVLITPIANKIGDKLNAKSKEKHAEKAVA